jgi:peptide/nickel transport system substrate-binding protein
MRNALRIAIEENEQIPIFLRIARAITEDVVGCGVDLMEGEATTGNQWVAPDNAFYAKNMPIPKRDVAKAKALLAEAGVPNPSFTLMTATTSDAQKIAQVVQAMVKEAGFDVKIQSTEFATSLDMADKGQFEAYVLAWSGRADPDGNLYSFDFCKAPLDYAGYCKPEVDELLNRSRSALDPDCDPWRTQIGGPP